MPPTEFATPYNRHNLPHSSRFVYTYVNCIVIPIWPEYICINDMSHNNHFGPQYKEFLCLYGNNVIEFYFF